MVGRSYVLLTVMALGLYGCSTTLSDRASRLRWVDQAQQVSGCEFLGIVDGSSTQSGIANISTGRNNARNEALEHAASRGATHIHWMSNDESFSGIHITAEAYKCGRNSPVASAVAEKELEPRKK